jgi:hypothetical protein
MPANRSDGKTFQQPQRHGNISTGTMSANFIPAAALTLPASFAVFAIKCRDTTTNDLFKSYQPR